MDFEYIQQNLHIIVPGAIGTFGLIFLTGLMIYMRRQGRKGQKNGTISPSAPLKSKVQASKKGAKPDGSQTMLTAEIVEGAPGRKSSAGSKKQAPPVAIVHSEDGLDFSDDVEDQLASDLGEERPLEPDQLAAAIESAPVGPRPDFAPDLTIDSLPDAPGSSGLVSNLTPSAPAANGHSTEQAGRAPGKVQFLGTGPHGDVARLDLNWEHRTQTDNIYTSNERERREREFVSHWEERINTTIAFNVILSSPELSGPRPVKPTAFNLSFRDHFFRYAEPPGNEMTDKVGPLFQSLYELYSNYDSELTCAGFVLNYLLYHGRFDDAYNFSGSILERYYTGSPKERYVDPDEYNKGVGRRKAVTDAIITKCLLHFFHPKHYDAQSALLYAFMVEEHLDWYARWVVYFNLQHHIGIRNLCAELMQPENYREVRPEPELLLTLYHYSQEVLDYNQKEADHKADYHVGSNALPIGEDITKFYTQFRTFLANRLEEYLRLHRTTVKPEQAIVAAGILYAHGKGLGAWHVLTHLDKAKPEAPVFRHIMLTMTAVQNGRWDKALDYGSNVMAGIKNNRDNYPVHFIPYDAFLQHYLIVRLKTRTVEQLGRKELEDDAHLRCASTIVNAAAKEKTYYMLSVLRRLKRLPGDSGKAEMDRKLGLYQWDVKTGETTKWDRAAGHYQDQQKIYGGYIHQVNYNPARILIQPIMEYLNATNRAHTIHSFFDNFAFNEIGNNYGREMHAYHLELTHNLEKSLYYYRQSGNRIHSHETGLRLVNVFLKLGFNTEAEELVKKLLRKYGDDDANLVNSYAILLSQTARLVEAERYFKWLVKKYPKNKAFRINRAINAEKLAKANVSEIWSKV